MRWEVVRGYLDGVAGGLTRPLRVFMDNASFHRSRGMEGEEGGVEGAGAYGGIPAPVQSPFEPHGGCVAAGEGVFDASAALRGVEELREAVVQALKALGVWS